MIEKNYSIELNQTDEHGIRLTHYEDGDGQFPNSKPQFNQDKEIIDDLRGLMKKLNIKLVVR